MATGEQPESLWNLKNQVNHVISILKGISANYIETKEKLD
jgi:hypothetical protein